MALPKSPYAVRNLLDLEARRLNTVLRPVVETESYIFLRNYIGDRDTIGFEIEIGLPKDNEDEISVRPMDLSISDGGLLHLAQLRGRPLPVAAAKFAEQIVTNFQGTFSNTLEEEQ